MRRVLALFMIYSLAISSFAQTQQGYVKTLGRPNQKGVALSGVTVRVKGEHNAVLSKADGTFSMHIQGESYSLQQVQKTGYELNEVGVIGRQYAYSDKVPLTIVMVSKAQLQADKQRIEDKAYQTAENNYKQQVELLEKQRAANAIAEEQYRLQIQDLQDKFDKYQSLIDGLADHYAHVDYDDLDEKEREINLCIENGELERADQLLQQLGIQQRIADIERRLATGQSLLDEANADLAAVMKQQEKDAEHLYQLYTIALSRFDRDKAKFYIETRAALDTTNVEWQNDAGRYIHEYVADYEKALEYFRHVLRQSIQQYGEESEWTARAYNNIGGVIAEQGNYSKALDYHLKALGIEERILGLEHLSTASTYNDIGHVYCNQSEYQKALECYFKALSIFEKTAGIESPYTAVCYNNIGAVYDIQGDNPNALSYYLKSLTIREKLFGIENPYTAISYNNLGFIYGNQGDYNKALEYFSKANVIMEKVYGKQHPKTALSYNNIGAICSLLEDNSRALEYYSKALTIIEIVYGLKHPSTAQSYNNIGAVYYEQSDYSKALGYYFKALTIYEETLGDGHPETAKSYSNIGVAYQMLEDYQKALMYHLKALGIREKAFGTSHPDTALSYYNIGIIYDDQSDYSTAYDYYKKALDIFEITLGSDHPNTKRVKEYLEEVKTKLK